MHADNRYIRIAAAQFVSVACIVCVIRDQLHHGRTEKKAAKVRRTGRNTHWNRLYCPRPLPEISIAISGRARAAPGALLGPVQRTVVCQPTCVATVRVWFAATIQTNCAGRCRWFPPWQILTSLPFLRPPSVLATASWRDLAAAGPATRAQAARFDSVRRTLLTLILRPDAAWSGTGRSRDTNTQDEVPDLRSACGTGDSSLFRSHQHSKFHGPRELHQQHQLHSTNGRIPAVLPAEPAGRGRPRRRY